MKKKIQQGIACIVFETDMKHSKSLNENILSEIQKQYLSLLPKDKQSTILAGQGAVVVDLEKCDMGLKKEAEICNFNMDTYQPPQEALKWYAESMARHLLPQIQEFYCHKENRKAFEKWQAEQKKSHHKK